MTITPMARPGALLTVRDLVIAVRGHEHLPLVKGIDLDVRRGETLALVGESGSGKTLTCNAIAGLIDTDLHHTGSVTIAGRSVSSMPEDEWNDVRGKDIGFIFQNPASALNPVMSVGEQVAEVLRRHHGLDRAAAWAEARRLFELARIPGAGERLRQYPHELSGGLCQRVAIAMAIACKPLLLLADEPTTALDVTIQAEIVRLLKDIQNEYGLAIVLVTHDLGVAAALAHDVAVMYAGTIVESGRAADLFDRPGHPYTRGLLACDLAEAEPGRMLPTIPGTVPPLASLVSGCPFRSRCGAAIAQCATTRPTLRSVAGDHRAACIRAASEVKAA